jgi:hypothetical protein
MADWTAGHRSIRRGCLSGNESDHVQVLSFSAMLGCLLSGLLDSSMEKDPGAMPPTWEVRGEQPAYNVRMDLAVMKAGKVVTCIEVKSLGSGEGLLSKIVEFAFREGGTYMENMSDNDSTRGALEKVRYGLLYALVQIDSR